MEKYKSYGTLSKTTHFLSVFFEADVVQQCTEAQIGVVQQCTEAQAGVVQHCTEAPAGVVQDGLNTQLAHPASQILE